jgi:hypothetical protein
MNPNGTPKNLRPPWRRGAPSPNPSGRPSRLPISDTYQSLADEPIPDSLRKVMKRSGMLLEPGATFAQALAMRVWMRALDGDPVAAKELREAMEGKAAQRATARVGSGPTEIRVRYDKALPAGTAPEPIDEK